MCFNTPFSRVFPAIALLWAAVPGQAQEDFVLRSDATEALVGLVVIPFDGVDKVADYADVAKPEEILRADLDFSGRFRVSTAAKWDSLAFSKQGATTVLTGTVKPGAVEGEVDIQFRLIDASSRDKLLEKTYSGRKKDLRRLAHRFSDDAVFQIFGERGIATTRIAFTRGREGHKELWTMDYDGFGAQAATKNGSINLSPVWDRDGGLIWSSYMGKDGAHLWRMENGGKPTRFLPSVPGMQISAAPSPIDGELALAVSIDGQTEIYRSYPNGKPVRLTFNPALEVSPSWSPNGWEIAFTSDRTGSPQVYAMDKDGANLRRITWIGGYNDQAAWSPAGDRIAFARQAGDFQILTISPDGGEEKWLGPGEQPKWSPDGRHLVFTRRFGTRSDVWICRADGSGTRQISFHGDASQPAWSK
ncbi:MAG: PD40 domain-containing protein [Fibrobacteres bacterium]|nr:PD40 domain-containing protein [Fibrobacterota bacterium]